MHHEEEIVSEDILEQAQLIALGNEEENAVIAGSTSLDAERLVEQLVGQERQRRKKQLRIAPRLEALILLLVFAAGLGSGYLLRDRIPVSQAERATAAAKALVQQVNPPEGFKLPTTQCH